MKFSIKDFSGGCGRIAGNCGFGRIFWGNLNGGLQFLCGVCSRVAGRFSVQRLQISVFNGPFVPGVL